MANKQSTKDVLYLRSVPPKLKHKFKTACNARSTNMTARIALLMMRDVRSYERNKLLNKKVGSPR